MPRFFVPQRDIADGKARLQGGEFRHLQRVLRLREGDP
jgi:16S rRNA U1498 N3-methylase RsmE